MSKLPPIPQEWWDDNRQRFDAESQAIELPKHNQHKHTFYRLSGSDIRCRQCSNGWTDPTGQMAKLLGL